MGSGAMRTSYREEDVILLLKDITGLVEPQPTKERERLIQSGRHYCEMLPIEYVPTEEYMRVYEEALKAYAAPTAAAAAGLAEKILQKRGPKTVLVSLARAGIPIGILLRRYLQQNCQAELPHYAVSIIRSRGIDHNAMQYLLDRYEPQQLLFVDGWVGKGAILKELKKEIAAYAGVSPDIAVLADPANVTDLCGTHEDILIPSSCLNCTVSGLISRTFLRSDVIGEKDFHGAVYYGELAASDLSYAFIEAVEKHFPQKIKTPDGPEAYRGTAAVRMDSACLREPLPGAALQDRVQGSGMEEVRQIAEKFQVADMNFIKPGIGETTRVLLRRIPWKVLVDVRWKDDRALRHVFRLAEEKNVPVVFYPLRHYKCCGIIKKMADV